MDLNGKKGFLVFDNSVFVLDAKSTTIGRLFVNDCIINDPHTSRQHAKIDYENGQYVIYDLSSTSGTFINHRKIERHVLSNGDIIMLGDSTIIFMYDENNIFS